MIPTQASANHQNVPFSTKTIVLEGKFLGVIGEPGYCDSIQLTNGTYIQNTGNIALIDQTQKRIAGPSIPEDQLCAYEDSCGTETTETTDEEETFDEGDSSEVPRSSGGSNDKDGEGGDDLPKCSPSTIYEPCRDTDNVADDDDNDGGRYTGECEGQAAPDYPDYCSDPKDLPEDSGYDDDDLPQEGGCQGEDDYCDADEGCRSDDVDCIDDRGFDEDDYDG